MLTQVVEAVAKISLKPEVKPLGESNHAAAAAPVLGFGNDDEDF